MRKNICILFIFAILLGSCAGLKTITIETQEPAQITLPQNVRSLLIVNNVVTQPDNVGHFVKQIGKRKFESIPVSMDSMAIYCIESLSHFLEEKQHFNKVLYYNKPLRTDSDFWNQRPITPDEMNRLRNENNVDVVVSLDELVFTTYKIERRTPVVTPNPVTYRNERVSTSYKEARNLSQGSPYADATVKIQSTFRVYIPTHDGAISTIQYEDSIKQNGKQYYNATKTSDHFVNILKVLPLYERVISKELTVKAAEKMTKALSPHWETQDRWYYTLSNASKQNGEYFAEQRKWDEAVVKWEEFFNENKKKINKAKAATNIALAYEMLEDMEQAYNWITTAYNLFEESVSTNSSDLKRTLLYKNEIERRYNNEKALKVQSL